jgi:ABC-type glycerol-3-phosphate transport system substrate-binding protein
MDDYETLLEFRTGKTAFLLDSSWAVTDANVNKELSQVAGKIKLMLIPHLPDTKSGLLYAGAFGLLKTSTHQEEGRKFLTTATSYEAQERFALKLNPPARVALFQDRVIADSWPGYSQIADQLLNHSRLPPQVPWLEDFRKSASVATADVIAGRKTPEEAQAWLLTEVTRIRGR